MNVKCREILVVAVALVMGEIPAVAQPKSAKTAATEKHALDAYVEMATASRKTLDGVTDYTATFAKMEVVKGSAYSNTMFMKFRAKPFSVYLYFVKMHRGRQVLYASGKYGNKLLARETGLRAIAGTVALKPDGPSAMKEGKFPITNIGMANMVDGVIAQWKAERKHADIKVTYYPNATLKRPDKTLAPMECKVLQSVHTKRRAGVEYARTRLYIDKKTNLPVRVEQYGFPRRAGERPPLLAEYTYWNVRLNAGLKDVDFDRKNPRYGL